MAAMQEVWIHLKIGDEPALDDSVLVKQDGNICDLRRAVKLNMANKLAHCDAALFQVFQQDETPLDIDHRIPSNSTRQNPLTIKAPKPQQGINRNI
jgi:hypothetical protein